MQRILLILVSIIASYVGISDSAALADDSQPAFLEIKETTPNRYTVVWRTPNVSGKRSELGLQLPETVRNLTPPVVRELPRSKVERRLIETDAAGLEGKRVTITGLEATSIEVLVRIEFGTGATTTSLIRPSKPWLVIEGPRNAWQITWDYTVLGFEHILSGFDHLLFVLALVLIIHGTRPLLLSITAFTLAHSITLAGATLGVLSVPGPPVEAIIALSIIFLASELAKLNRGKPSMTANYPWIVAFSFGLLHGLGFAGALADVGLPQHEIPLALLMFNIGVELGQLVFVSVVLVIMASFRRLRAQWPFWVLQLPAYGIGSIASLWFIERVSGF